MRPTFSIIAFTVLSGAGYGVLFLCGIALAGGLPVAPYPAVFVDDFHFGRPSAATTLIDPRLALGTLLAVGATLAVVGLLCSLGHLGQPQRAWRALTQWRSSWLSREGVFALAAFVPLGACAYLLHAPSHVFSLRVAGLALASFSGATVFCTARIYSSLKPVRAWHQPLVPPAYLLLGLYAGSLWSTALALVPALEGLHGPVRWLWLSNALVLAPACALLKRTYWQRIDALPDASAGYATGLDAIGAARTFEAPHTEMNYLTHEMGFVLARKHSRTLRAIAFWLILLTPLGMLPALWLVGWIAACIALAVGTLGLFVERWLFFAEAKHAVMAYYAR
jgi:DMSO reductase anchor subunit